MSNYTITNALLKDVNRLLEIVAENTAGGITFNLTKYNFKGAGQDIGTTPETPGIINAINFTDIFLPFSNTTIQISSTDNADLGKLVEITGYDEDFNEIFAVANNLGNTPVTIAEPFFRITGMRMASAVNVGDIYLSVQGAPLFLGRPTNQTDYIYSILNGESQANILNGCIPPKLEGEIRPFYINYITSTSQANGRGQIVVSYKRTNSATWYNYLVIYFNGRGGSGTWRLDGANRIPNSNIGTPWGYDWRIQVNRIGGGGTINVSADFAAEQ